MRTWRSPYPPSGNFVLALHALLRSEAYVFDDDESGQAPSSRQLSVLLNTAFWATLRPEEGRYARVALALTKSSSYSHRAVFKKPIELSVETLVKLSPLLCEESSCLGVQSVGRDARLECWGVCHEPSATTLALRSEGPGQFVVSIGREVVADVLPGQRPRIIGPDVLPWNSTVPHFLVNSGLSDTERFDIAYYLRFLANAMQHGRGGTVLLVRKPDTWKASLHIKYEVGIDQFRLVNVYDKWSKESKKEQQQYRRKYPDSSSSDILFMSKDTPAERQFKRVIRSIGGLTAVDGATVLTTAFDVIGFGAKILPLSEPPATIQRFDPFRQLGDSGEWKDTPLSAAGGMRHRSAIQFVRDNPHTLAFVASQDGALTLFRESNSGVLAVSCESLMPLPE